MLDLLLEAGALFAQAQCRAQEAGVWDNEDRDDLDAARGILFALAITALLLICGVAIYGAFKAWLA